MCEVNGMILPRVLYIKDSLGSNSSSSPAKNIFTAVKSKNAPNKYVVQANLLMINTPKKIISPLKTIAPKIPQKRTRCWYFCGILKAEKIIAITKILSTLSDSSIK